MAQDNQFHEKHMKNSGSRTAAAMRKFAACVLLSAMLCSFLAGCDGDFGDSEDGTGAVTTANRLIQVADIEQNEQIITPAPKAWGVKFLEIPDGCKDAFRNQQYRPSLYYYEDENLFRAVYRETYDEQRETSGGAVINVMVTAGFTLAEYSMTGELLSYEKVKHPEGTTLYEVSLNKDGYYYFLSDGSKTMLSKYFFETGETEIVFDNIMDIGISSGNIVFHDGYYYTITRDILTVTDESGNKVAEIENPVTVFMDFVIHNEVLYVRDFGNYLFIPNIKTGNLDDPDFPKSPEILGDKFNDRFDHHYEFTLENKSEKGRVFQFGNRYRALGDNYDIYYHNDEGLYGQKFVSEDDKGDAELLIDYNASGLELGMFGTVIPFNAKAVFATLTDVFSSSPQRDNLRPALLFYDEKTASEGRKAITVAYTRNLSYNLRRFAAYFNMTNPEYRVDLVNYAQYNTTELPNGGADRLELEFSTGKYPDMLIISDDMDFTNYTRKGYIKNLYDLGFDGSRLIGGVRSVSEFASGLYRLPLTFSHSLITNRLGIERMTLDDMLSLYEKHGSALFLQLNRKRLIDCLIDAGILAGFIDYESAKCSFDDESFIRLLEFLRSYDNIPAENVTTPYYSSLTPETQQLVKADETVMFVTGGSDLSYMTPAMLDYLYDGEEYSISGFPTTDDNSGIIISCNEELAVTEACAYPEGAMKFIELLFSSRESAEYMNQRGWVTNADNMLSRIREHFGDEKNILFFDIASNSIATFRNSMDNTDYITNNPNRIVIDLTEEELDRYISRIFEADVRAADDPRLLEIVWDELTPFLAGQDTAENVAHRINSRVGIYLAERYG